MYVKLRAPEVLVKCSQCQRAMATSTELPLRTCTP
uniref:Uncharacterized protein n=1 Tax=Anguilla anguilla TaxID=7936 RepID=A0A0E9R8K2_ANGAN